jgi:Flp pilus assembly protein TadG
MLHALRSRRQRTTDERGAVAGMLVGMIVVLLGSAALALDLGQHWAARRNIVTASDASALAAAREFAFGGDGCTSVAASYVTANYDGADLDSCASAGSEYDGTVTVAASSDLDLLFAPVLGFESDSVDASTTARYGAPLGVRRLRPFGLCLDADAFDAWTDRSTGYGPIRITYGKSHPSDCGSRTPGNWGILDFNGGSVSNAETSEWVLDGYPGTVTAPTWIGGSPGAFSNTLPLGSIVGETFPLPLFDGTGESGSNAQFHVVGFVNVTLHAFRATGPQANRYLEVSFVTGILQGTCCGVPETDTGVRVVGICAVDPDQNC